MTLVLLLLILFAVVIVYLRCFFRMCTSNVCMKGKVVIVTGANGGIGFQAAKNIAKRGARVILACRSEERALVAQASIIKLTGNKDIVFRKLDLSSLNSVRKFAANIMATEDQLHVLVNNAGVYGFTNYTDDGIIETLQVNYLGHFLLTLLLLPLLKKSQPSRIINLSSNLHFLGCFKPETFNKKLPLGALFDYCNSKFCMLMFTVELSRRLAGTGVVANAAHPGVIMTGISSNGPLISHLLCCCWCLMYNRSPEQGAQTIEHLAVAEECADVSGKYFVDCASRLMLWTVRKETAAKHLWEYSEKLTNY